MVTRINNNFANWDPGLGADSSISFGYFEQLFGDDWTVNPADYTFQLNFRPNNYVEGYLAQSWEFTGPSTFVVELRHGILWQNIAPANGRELVAADIVAHYSRFFGLNGYPGMPFWKSVGMFKNLIGISANGKYEVVFQYSNSNQESILETIQTQGHYSIIENPEAVKLWGDLTDWHHAIGSGPFILTDFVSGVSTTMVRNPNYWMYDERYPQNKLPYVDSIKYLVITDNATALSALRTGKIDVMDALLYSDVASMKKTNPDILSVAYPAFAAMTIDPRNDKAPFSDIRVRKAMQMTINLASIAKDYYGGYAESTPAGNMSDSITGWGYPYSTWTDDEKAGFAFNVAGAKALLTAAGLPNGFSTTLTYDSAADADLLQLLVSYMAAANINVTLVPMESASYISYIGAHSNMTLTARKVGTLGKSNGPSGAANTWLSGTKNDIAMVNDPEWDALYNQMQAATTIDSAKAIAMAACKMYVDKQYIITTVIPKQFGLYQPWLHGYNAQQGAISGPGGPSFIDWYGARYWIDSTLKTSLTK
jgi:peptide/nickel transport system substrate-binding protein